MKNDIPFSEIKRDALAMIEKIKASDPERGAYLEYHIVFDDKNEAMAYTGDAETIDAIIKKSIYDIAVNS